MSPVSTLRERLTTQRNATILAAIVVAIPTAYAFHSVTGSASGDFLLLFILGVGVPTAYDSHWPEYDRTWKAVAWTVAACAVATVEFVGLYLVGTRVLDQSELVAAVGAFLVTYLGDLAVLAAAGRR